MPKLVPLKMVQILKALTNFGFRDRLFTLPPGAEGICKSDHFSIPTCSRHIKIISTPLHVYQKCFVYIPQLRGTKSPKYWFLLFDSFASIFYFLEMNLLRYITIPYHHFENLITITATHLILGRTLIPQGGQNIDFLLLKLLHWYFTFWRLIDWDI